MKAFGLDPRLKRDCHHLTKLDLSHILLMDNALLPWFILVPETDKTEIIDLNICQQNSLLNEVNVVSQFIRQTFNSQKLNTAAIGNIVQQLHIHIVGRQPGDYCWPEVVWGTEKKKIYELQEVERIKESLHKFLD